MRTPTVEREAAVGRDEAIRAEIRAQLRAPNASLRLRVFFSDTSACSSRKP